MANPEEKSITTTDALIAATKDKDVQQIAISGRLTVTPDL